MEKNVKLSPPWNSYYSMVSAMFNQDPDVIIRIEEDEYTIHYYVSGADKAAAIEKILPSEVEFGNITVKNIVHPANDDNLSIADIYQRAFAGNPVFSKIGRNRFGSYVIFRKEVVQYYNDDLSDFNRVCTTLYEDIAKEIFPENPEIHFCTDVE